MSTNHDAVPARPDVDDGFAWARAAGAGARPDTDSAGELYGDRVPPDAGTGPTPSAPITPPTSVPIPRVPGHLIAPASNDQASRQRSRPETDLDTGPDVSQQFSPGGDRWSTPPIPGYDSPSTTPSVSTYAAGPLSRGDHPLASSSIVRARATRPREGWRSVVYSLTGGLIAPRLSQVELHRKELVRRVRTPLPGPRKITVASMKGGVGKTTVAGVLGRTLAEHRGDLVIAIDANPDAGTLADRLVGEGPGPTIRELISDFDRITASTELARYTRLAGRLRVLPSEQDPAMSEQFNRDEYEAVISLLERFYDILITDSGTGVVHSAMHGALDHSDQLVVVGAPTVDAASRAAKTLDWLIEHDFEQLVRDAVVVLSRDRESPDVDRALIHGYFAERCRAVVDLPPDPHLATGGVIDLALLGQATVDGALELTAHVADGFYDHRPSSLVPATDPGRLR